MANVPLVSGSVGFAPGPAPISALFEGLGNAEDIYRAKQLLHSQQQAEEYQNAAAQREAIGQRIYNDPTLANNPQILKQIQALYKGTGVGAPITQTPMKDAQGQVVPGKFTQSADAGALTGNTFFQYVQKNLPQVMATHPQDREGILRAQGIAMSDAQRKQLQSLPFQLPFSEQEKMDKDIETSFDRDFNAAMKGGFLPAARAAVQKAMAQAKAANWPDERAQATFGTYLESSVANLSPMQVAKIAEEQAKTGLDKASGRRDDAVTGQINTLLGARLQEIKQTVSLRKEQGDHLRQLDKTLTRMTDSRVGLNNTLARKYLGDAADAIDREALIGAEAEWYTDRADQIKTMRGQDPRAFTAAMSAVTSGMNNSQNVIRGLQGSLAQMTSQMASASSEVRRNQEPIIEGIRAQLREEINRYNSYAQTMNTLNPMFAVPPMDQGDGGSAPAPAPAAAPANAPANASAAAPQTRVNPANGKTYYLHSDGKYYLTRG